MGWSDQDREGAIRLSLIDRKIAKSIASYSVPHALFHWHVARVLTLCARTAERILTEEFFSAWTDDSNAIWPIAICFVPHGTSFDQITPCSRTAGLIWTEPTIFYTGNRWERGCVDVWVLSKWHVALAIGTFQRA